MNGSPVNKLSLYLPIAHVSAVKISFLDRKAWQLGGLLILGLLAAACDGTAPDLGDAEVGAVSQAMVGSNPCDDPSSATIVGTPGDDYLLGTSGDDVIFGLGGDDLIVGKGGNDILCGGTGNDQLQGGAGHDVLHGGAGYNTLHGHDGDDALYGGDDGNELQGGLGDDTLIGGASYDWILGGDGHDSMDGGAGDDDMNGGAGDDAIYGGSGDDWMLGGAGNDCIDGGPGDDQLHGEDGDDGLVGGDGIDQLVCGAGADTHGEGEWDFSSCESAGMCSATGNTGGLGIDGGTGAGCFEADCSMYPDDPACCDHDTSVCGTSGVCEEVPGDIEGQIWIDFNGDGIMDAGDLIGVGITVELFEDKSPADGLPDGAPIASTLSTGDGSYRFSGLLGRHIARVNLAVLPGLCQSSGLNSRIDPLTDYSEPVLVMGANPIHVVSGLDIGLKFVGCP